MHQQLASFMAEVAEIEGEAGASGATAAEGGGADGGADTAATGAGDDQDVLGYLRQNPDWWVPLHSCPLPPTPSPFVPR